MAIILNIDTAVETASVCLSDNDKVLGMLINETQHDHAAWLHTAISDLLQRENLSAGDIKAVAVSIGPGSYTGLRLALSTAKGLCYALNIPLITINTLKMLAHSSSEEAIEWICPLIDARRMEVFTAIYDKFLHEVIKPASMIINKNSFFDILSTHHLTFCGNGMKKLQQVLHHPNAVFSPSSASAADLAPFAADDFREKKFADLAYCEPLYIKDFYSPAHLSS